MEGNKLNYFKHLTREVSIIEKLRHNEIVKSPDKKDEITALFNPLILYYSEKFTMSILSDLKTQEFIE